MKILVIAKFYQFINYYIMYLSIFGSFYSNFTLYNIVNYMTKNGIFSTSLNTNLLYFVNAFI